MSDQKEEMLEIKVAPKEVTDKLEEEIMKGEKVTEEKIEDSLNYDLLSEAEKKAIDEFCEKIDVTDSTQVLQFGSSAQNKISEFSDSVLDSVKTKNAGEVGDLLSSLVVEVKNFDAGVPSTMNPKGLQGMFFNAKKQIQKIIAKYDDVENNIDKIEKQLETHKIKMLKDITIYDTMYEKNLDYFNEISLYIIAGEKKLKELKEVVLPELQAKAKETGEQVDAQKANDMINTINRFEKKLYDLKTTRIISIQMAPQIRLIQNNDSELVEKIQSSLINTIPLWKNQIVIALGLTNSKAALEAQKSVTQATNDMLKKNSEMLKQGTIDIAEESERAIVDIETLKKTNQDIIETLDKVLEIHANGRAKRVEAEKELLNIEKELKDKMLEIKVNNNENNE